MAGKPAEPFPLILKMGELLNLEEHMFYERIFPYTIIEYLFLLIRKVR
ncbi:MAG: hypothetical protein GYA26_09790 [Flexilinea flocculi]|jgi:hypothetical protein|nr:hypothetical protein [Flexilinea flocculi]